MEYNPRIEGTMNSRHEQTDDVKMESLVGCRDAMMLPAPEQPGEDDVLLRDSMEAAMSSYLTDQQKSVLKYRFWKGLTLREVGDKIGCTPMRVKTIQDKALRRLRQKECLRMLGAYDEES